MYILVIIIKPTFHYLKAMCADTPT